MSIERQNKKPKNSTSKQRTKHHIKMIKSRKTQKKNLIYVYGNNLFIL